MKKVLESRKDIVFYIKMFPLTSLHPQAYEKSQAIVCEKDNAKALQMLEDVFAKKEIPKPACTTDVIDKNIELARQLGISGTPAIIFDNGSLKSGAMSSEQLIQFIDTK